MRHVQKEINVAHLRDSGGMHGAERVMLTLARNVDPERFNLSFICMHRRDGRSEDIISQGRKAGIPVFPVPTKGRLDLSTLRTLRRIIVEHRIDILHTHDFKSDFYAVIATSGLPVKRVATAHGSTRDSLLKRLYLYIDEKFTYRFFDHIIAVSNDLRAFLEGRNVSAGKITVIQNGVDPDLLQLCSTDREEPPSVPPGRTVFAVIGRLFPDKGHQYVLQALAEVRRAYPEVFCLIIGTGPEQERLSQLIETLAIADIVQLCGYRKNMDQIYSMIDYVVIPSLTEGTPYVLLEAMSLRIPVLATSVGDIPELLTHTRTGLLIPPGDVHQLKEGMLTLLGDPASAAKMAESARDFVYQNFSATQMARRTELLYEALVTPTQEL